MRPTILKLGWFLALVTVVATHHKSVTIEPTPCAQDKNPGEQEDWPPLPTWQQLPYQLPYEQEPWYWWNVLPPENHKKGVYNL